MKKFFPVLSLLLLSVVAIAAPRQVPVGYLDFTETDAVTQSPATGRNFCYFKTDGKKYCKDDTGTERLVAVIEGATASGNCVEFDAQGRLVDAGAACGTGTGSGSGESVVKAIAQNSHGFSVGSVIRHNGTSYVTSDASSDSTSEVYGIVSAVPDSNNFSVTTHGYISGLSGLVAGEAHFLSETAGAVTSSAPTTTGTVNKPILLAVSASAGFVNIQRGFVNSSSGSGGSQFAGEAYIAGTTQCFPTRASSTFGALTDDADCPGPTIVAENLGDWQTTDANNIAFTINNLPAGTYEFTMNAYVDAPTSAWCAWYLGDGTNVGSMVSFYRSVSTVYATGTSKLIATYPTTTNVTLKPFMASFSGSTCYALNFNSADSSAFFETKIHAIKISD